LRIANANREGDQQGTPPRPSAPADVEMNPFDTGSREVAVDHSQPQWVADDPISSETSNL
jgi:hypothetical protein